MAIRSILAKGQLLPLGELAGRLNTAHYQEQGW